MKKLITLLLVLAMVLGLVACGAKTEPATSPEVSTAPETSTEQETTPVEQEPEADMSWKEEHPSWLCEETTTLCFHLENRFVKMEIPHRPH